MPNLVEIVKQTNDGFVFDNKLLFNILDTIGDKNVSIVSIIGAKSTGKTLLLDYLLRFIKTKQSDKHCNYFANESVLKRFELSGDMSGDQPQTNGIFIWCEPLIVTTKDGEEMALILMETCCGFECNESINEECGQIFAISSLLSSTLILNIKNDLTEDLLKFVEYFTNFAQTMNSESKLDICQRLVFLLRDWAYERSNRFGCGDDYIGFNEFFRSFCNSNDSQCVEELNERKSLMSLIDDISCYLMPNPGCNATKPGFWGQIDLIDKDFTVKMEEFVAFIIENIEPKVIGGHKQIGNSLKDKLKNWQQIMENQNDIAKPLARVSNESGLELAFIYACSIYEKKIETCVESNPTDEELLNNHIIAEEEMWNYFTAELNARVSDANANQMLESLRERIAVNFENCRLKNLQRIENKLINLGIARSAKRFEKYSSIPNNNVCLELPCPGYYYGSCDRKDQYWMCEKCEELLEYGFDEYLYCFCGKANNCFEFKCNSKSHSTNYIQFTQNQLKELLSRKEINILILGETGVGKSTWINGFANYLTYPSLTEATKHELLSLIACSFTITDNNFEERVISIGEDTNEVFTTGQSATQEPKSYVFNCDNKLIRIIDTPGIGDTRGYEQDKKNFDAILRYLTNLDKLHGICILLKPNNARLGVMFKFCIKELLTHLHRDASRNIVFCFTNSRSTFYRPGDTMPALKSLLSENKNEVEINLSKETVYCMDNEPFRFLCAYQHGIQFDEEDCDNYAKSWDKSVNETKRMLDYICGLTPHSVSNTLSLNDTRKIIVSLSKPLADITQNILTNINVVEDKKREILNTKESERNLKSKLYMNVIQLEAKQLRHPRTVCTDQKCVKFHKIDGSNQYTTEFVTHCHEKCGIRGVTPESYPNLKLKYCSSLKETGKCVKCGCSWELHMHIVYEQIPITMQVRDSAVEELIKNKKTIREGIELQINKMEQYVKELNYEKDMITKISAKFGGFLKAYSIVPYNDALGEYLDLLIRMEKDKVSAGGDRKTLDGLEQMKNSYNEEIRLLDQFMANQGKEEQLTPICMIDLVNQLYALKHKGKELQQIMQVMSASKMEMYKFNETNCNVKNKKKNALKHKRRELQQMMSATNLDNSVMNIENQMNIFSKCKNFVKNRLRWKY